MPAFSPEVRLRFVGRRVAFASESAEGLPAGVFRLELLELSTGCCAFVFITLRGGISLLGHVSLEGYSRRPFREGVVAEQAQAALLMLAPIQTRPK